MTDQTVKKHAKQSGLLRSSLTFSAMTLISRVLGLVRDMAIAILAGATAHADAFFIAFKIPNFLRRLFAEGAFSQAFVPVLSEYRTKGPFEAVKALIDRVAAVLGLSVFLVSILAVALAPFIAMLFAPGFTQDPQKFAMAVELIRITFPYLFFITLTGLAGAILNSYQRFAVPAITPIILNICLILAAIYGAKLFAEPIYALAFGVLIAGACQLLFQLPFLIRLQLLPKPTLDFQHPGVKKILTLMVPALFGVSVSQINLLLDTVIASFLPTGSISWLYYSDRLIELPLGVFAIAVSTVILPSLSRKQAAQSSAAYTETLSWGLRMILFISIPAAMALFVLAQPILTTLFQYGQLTAYDVKMASFSLQAYSLGLLPMMLIKVLASGFYAQQDMKTPVKIGIVALIANMVFNLALAIPLHFYYQIGFVGLALATGLSSLVNSGLLIYFLAKRGVLRLSASLLLQLLRYILAATIMVLLLYWLQPDPSQWSIWPATIRVLSLLKLVGIGLLCYLVVVFVLGARLRDFRAAA